MNTCIISIIFHINFKSFFFLLFAFFFLFVSFFLFLLQWSCVQIPLRLTFYSHFKESFSGEYHINHSFRYTHVITLTKLHIKANVATDEGNNRNET